MTVLFSACGHDELVPPDVYEGEPPTPYVELRIMIPVVNPYTTRSHPTGGEDGNGRERGVLKEDKIHDINIFFYKDPNGLDGNDNSDILHQIYYNIDNESDEANSPLLEETNPVFEKNYLDLKFALSDKIVELGVGTKFAAVANFGEIQKGTITKLGQLRNLAVSKYSEAWKTNDPFSNDASQMDWFLMSTAYNTDYTYGTEHTGNNQIEANGSNYSGTTTLERMYARIDLWYNAKENAGIEETSEAGKLNSESLKYTVTGASDNKVYIYNILPVNVMRQPSFLFKKVSSTEPKSWDVATLKNLTKFNWGGKEQVSNGCPSNYVLEPNTTNKTKEGVGPSVDLDTWYKSSKTDQVKTEIKYNKDRNTSEDKGKVSSYYSKYQPAGDGDPTVYNCNRISIISYANENTHGTDCFHSNYLTGLAFRAVYVPDKIYKGYTTTTVNGTTTVDATVWSSDDEDPTQIFRYSPTNRTPKEIKSKYFTNREAAEKYAEGHPEDMAIISDAYTAIKHTLEDGSQKWGFICYYNLWLRHYNDENDTNTDPHPHLPMEYATVRNNIYRVSISFNGPGDSEPTMREPDTMKARIFVRKWNYREESTITF